MYGSKNVYYDPEAFGLTTIGQVEFSSGSYEYDTLVVWEDREGRLFYAEDAGCSCPTPFDGHDLFSITPVRSGDEILSRIDHRLSVKREYPWHSRSEVANAKAERDELAAKFRERK